MPSSMSRRIAKVEAALDAPSPGWPFGSATVPPPPTEEEMVEIRKRWAQPGYRPLSAKPKPLPGGMTYEQARALGLVPPPPR